MKDVFFVKTRTLASFWPAPKLKGKRWNMELDPWQPQLQQVFGEFRCGKTQLCLSLGLVTLDRLDQRVVVSAQSCEQVIFVMKRKEGEILDQCGKSWYDVLLWYVCQSSCCNIHLVWSPGLFWGHTLCVACQLPISKGGGESKVPNPSYPKFHFQKLPFEDCIIFSLFSTEHVQSYFYLFFPLSRHGFCFPCLLHPRTLQKCDVEICWWLPAFDEIWQSFDLKQTTCSLYFGGIRGKLPFHHFNLMVLIHLMSLGGFVHRHGSLLLSSSKKHEEAPCNGFPLVFVHQTSGDISTRAPGRYCKTLWPEWRGWVQRCWRFISNFDLLNLENPQAPRGICWCQFDWEHLWLWLQTVEVLRLPELKLDRMSWKMWHMLALTMRSIRTAALGETVDTNNKIRRVSFERKPMDFRIHW